MIAAAGDISCEGHATGSDDHCRQRATSNLFRGRRLAAILTLGDNQYQEGTREQFRRYFHPTWGRFKRRIRPGIGNHEYETSGADGYFHYFGRRAGKRSRGYYSFNLGRWHIISLNSNCGQAGGCSRGSPQNRWLRRDLRRHKRRCTLAYWHHPRFSSGQHGNQEDVIPFWQALYRYRADVVLSGHDHDYERFARQSPSGRLKRRGIRQFVVGTGGSNHYPFSSSQPHSQVKDSQTFGALFMRLRPRSYRFWFVPEPGKSFRDKGRARCR
jgi:acid phosphatase type 7